jgi:hypothetical protein
MQLPLSFALRIWHGFAQIGAISGHFGFLPKGARKAKLSG